MIVEAKISIKASRDAVWAAITNIENAQHLIDGIENIEIVARPPGTLVGLRWKETRILFGEPATVEKWITQAVKNDFYETRAEDSGFVFITTMRLADHKDGTALISAHDSRPQGLIATLKSIPMVLFFRSVIRKAIRKDLEDIKAALEAK